MNRGDVCIQEFVRIADFLLKPGKMTIQRGYILAPRNVIDRLLARNQYETNETKLQHWKKLYWMDADRDRFTKQVPIGSQRSRVVKTDIQVSQTLGILLEEILVEKQRKSISSILPGQNAIYNKKFSGNLHRHDNRLQIYNICSCSGRRRIVRDRGGSSISQGRYRDGVRIDRVRWMSIMAEIDVKGVLEVSVSRDR